VRTRAGKAYKEWIFARATGDVRQQLPAIEGGASLILRDVVREHLRSEYAPACVRSMDQPFEGTDGHPLTLGDLLPSAGEDPSAATVCREMDRLAAETVAAVLPTLSARERRILRAQAGGIFLEDRTVLRQCGCRRSALYRSARMLTERVAARLSAALPGEPREALVQIGAATMEGLRRAVSLNEMLDRRPAVSFVGVSGADNRVRRGQQVAEV
jgi:hypothetical protein